MASTILGLFDDPIDARRAVEQLRDSSLKLDDVSIVSRATESGAAISSVDDVSAGEGAAVGAVWGGLVGLAALLIPGVGPFIALGALGAALTGAVTGAVVGGIAAALIDFGGIPEDEARAYESQVHAGKTLVAVKVDAEHADEARRLLVAAGADSLYDNQTDLASGTQSTSVHMADAAGRSVSEAEEFGAPSNPTTVQRDASVSSVIEPSPNSTEPLIEDAPRVGRPLGVGRTGPVTPDNAPLPETGEQTPRTLTPDKDTLPPPASDTNIPAADERDKPAA